MHIRHIVVICEEMWFIEVMGKAQNIQSNKMVILMQLIVKVSKG